MMKELLWWRISISYDIKINLSCQEVGPLHRHALQFHGVELNFMILAKKLRSSKHFFVHFLFTIIFFFSFSLFLYLSLAHVLIQLWSWTYVRKNCNEIYLSIAKHTCMCKIVWKTNKTNKYTILCNQTRKYMYGILLFCLSTMTSIDFNWVWLIIVTNVFSKIE